MTIPKSGVQELAVRAHEMGAGVLRGSLQRLSEERGWAIGNVHLRDWLARYEDQDVILIAVAAGEARALATKTCRTCGREYKGSQCPHCRETRERLRGKRHRGRDR
jgi:rubrerythrin